MKKIIKIILILMCAFCAQQIKAGRDLYGKTFYSPRTQSDNKARLLVGQHPFTHKLNGSSCYGTFSATPEYQRSFKDRRMAEHFFGTNTIRFSGSRVTTRTAGDLLADYFGLSPTFDSTIEMKPKVQNFMIDFAFYLGLDGIKEGLYCWIHAPAVWSQHEFKLCETIANSGVSTAFPARYMDSISVNAPIQSAKRPFDGNVTFGHVKEGIKYGKIGCPQEQRGLSDLQMIFGWDFIKRERGFFGANLFVSAPTGKRPTGEYLFEPVVGNGKHWELGLGLAGNVLLWEKDGDQTLSIHVDATMSHMFRSQQCRSFDLLNAAGTSSSLGSSSFGSRFILLKEFEDSVYNDTLIPAINKTTLQCKVSVDVKVDGLFMLAYHNRNWTFDFGYEGWIRSREKICLCEEIESNKYALKGIQYVYGADDINRTQSTATLHGNELTDAIRIAAADDPSPIFISTSDLDLCSGAMPRSITHKLFMHVQYAWSHGRNQRTIPYLGFGGQVEFEGLKIYDTRPNKNTLSLVSFWAKAGLAF